MLQNIEPKNLRFNYTVNLLDGAFFGLGIGFASFSTIIPLFFSSLTDSALIIGLIPAIHNACVMLPQLFSARVSGFFTPAESGSLIFGLASSGRCRLPRGRLPYEFGSPSRGRP